MTKICTSIEQSKKLLSLGLDPSTADMFYEPLKGNPIRYAVIPSVGKYGNWNMPAWSLTALLELMPKTIEKQGVEFFLRILCYESNWYIDYASLEQSYLYSSQLKSLVEASILIIEQLIQEGHIKVNK